MTMKYIAILLLFTSSLSFASTSIKPGLWKIDMTMKQAGGKEMNISKQMEEAMAKVPAAQREKMKDMMKGIGKGVGNFDPTKVCFTKDMVNNPKSVSKHQQQEDCDTNVVSKSDKKIVSTFTCKNGTKGKTNITFENDKNYKGVVDITSPEGKSSRMEYEANFVSSDCGDVKPIKET